MNGTNPPFAIHMPCHTPIRIPNIIASSTAIGAGNPHLTMTIAAIPPQAAALIPQAKSILPAIININILIVTTPIIDVCLSKIPFVRI